MGDAFHRGGARMDAYLELTMAVHRNALRFRCVGAASVLWTWLGHRPAAGHGPRPQQPLRRGRRARHRDGGGRDLTDYAGAPLTLASSGAMAAVPGIQPELVRLAADLAAASV